MACAVMAFAAVPCRYVIAAVDPAYGRALTVTTLEPDYSQELHRFVSVAELTRPGLPRLSHIWLA